MLSFITDFNTSLSVEYLISILSLIDKFFSALSLFIKLIISLIYPSFFSSSVILVSKETIIPFSSLISSSLFIETYNISHSSLDNSHFLSTIILSSDISKSPFLALFIISWTSFPNFGPINLAFGFAIFFAILSILSINPIFFTFNSSNIISLLFSIFFLSVS